jgi:hypothetical protein
MGSEKVTLPNMGMDLPINGMTTSPYTLTYLISSLQKVDAHDHSSGKGARLSQASIQISSDWAMSGFGFTGVKFVGFSNPTGLTDAPNASSYFKNGDFYLKLGDGTEIRITKNGSLNTALVGGFTGDYASAEAFCVYDEVSNTYAFNAGVDTPDTLSTVVVGRLSIRSVAEDANLYGVGLTTSGNMTASYDVELPDELPAQESVWLLSTAGGLSYAATATFVRTTGNQTLDGIKSFTSFPVTPSSAPTLDYQVANKKFVEDEIVGFDAPDDGTEYVRKDNTWVPNSGGSFPEAPVDGKQYARKNAAWDQVSIPVQEAPVDGKQYAREDGEWSEVVNAVTEAPEDGLTYGRKDASWVESVSDVIDGETYLRKNGGWVKYRTYNARPNVLDQNYIPLGNTGSPAASSVSDAIVSEDGNLLIWYTTSSNYANISTDGGRSAYLLRSNVTPTSLATASIVGRNGLRILDTTASERTSNLYRSKRAWTTGIVVYREGYIWKKDGSLIIGLKDTRNGVMRSIDGGITWSESSTSLSFIASLSFSTDEKFIYTLNSSTLYRSSDNGATFSSIGALETGRAYALTKSALYSSLNSNGSGIRFFSNLSHTSNQSNRERSLFFSENFSAEKSSNLQPAGDSCLIFSYTANTFSAPAIVEINTLQIRRILKTETAVYAKSVSQKGKVACLGNSGNGSLHISRFPAVDPHDAGGIVVRIDSTYNDFYCTSLQHSAICASRDGQYIFSALGGYVRVSSNAGSTFTTVTATSDAQYCYASLASSHNGQYVLLSGGNRVGGNNTSKTLYISSNYGVSFSSVSGTNGNWSGICASSTGQYMAGCRLGGNIFTSSNYGVSWISRASSANWHGICCSADGQVLFAIDHLNGYVWKSVDYGENWTQITASGQRDWVSIKCSDDGLKVIALAAASFVRTSIDGGTSWSDTGEWGAGHGVHVSPDGGIFAMEEGEDAPWGSFNSKDAGGLVELHHGVKEIGKPFANNGNQIKAFSISQNKWFCVYIEPGYSDCEMQIYSVDLS